MQLRPHTLTPDTGASMMPTFRVLRPQRAIPVLRHSSRQSRPRFLSVSASLSSQTASPPSSSSSTGSSQRPTSVIREIQRDLASGARSAVDVAQEYVSQLKKHEETLHSFTFWDPQSVLDQASQLDREINGPDRATCLSRPLVGVPIAVKDNICTRDMPSSAGSNILKGYKAPYDATAVRQIRQNRGLLIGKTNMDEFGMGSSCEQSAFEASRNPWDTARVPGGSSGGSASAVAAGQCAVSLGSDTGGSVRQPASFCGVVGLKPTYGRVSRSGLIAYASSLDVIGCLTPSVEDAAIVLNAISGFDSSDSTSSREAVPDFAEKLRPVEALTSQPLKGVRMGVIRETMGEGVDPQVCQAVTGAIQHLESLGAQVNEVSLPSFPLGLPAYYILAASEASSNLSRYDGLRFGLQKPSEDLTDLYRSTRGEGFGPEVKRRILMGTYALSAGFYDAYYKRAQQVRALILQDFSKALEENDFLVTPTAPTPAFRIGEKTSDPLTMYAGDLMTVNVNLAGLPALSIPCGLATPSDGETSVKLPVGMQLIGKAFQEGDILTAGHIYEQTTTSWPRHSF